MGTSQYDSVWPRLQLESIISTQETKLLMEPTNNMTIRTIQVVLKL